MNRAGPLPLHDAETPGGNGRSLRPSAFWLLLLAAWAARVAVGLVGDQLLHPDEISQYLEPAHGVVFGAQMYSLEFIAGGRTWIIPGFVAGILYALDLAGLGDPAYYVPTVKVAFCTLSLILPAAMYFLGRNLFGEATGRIAFAIGCFWYEFVGLAHKPLSDMVSCYFAVAAMALASSRHGVAAPALSGAMTMLAFGVRYQIGVLAAPFALIALAAFSPAQRVAFLAAAAAGLAAVALLDHLTWGGFFHSLLFIGEHNSRIFWEIHVPFHAYYLWTGAATAGLFWITVAWSLTAWRKYWPALALIALFFLSHQGFTHKEYRFFFPWIPIWLLVAADLARRARQSQMLKRLKPEQATCLVLAPFALVSLAGIANLLPLQKDLYKANLTEIEPVYRFLHRDPHLQRYIDLGKDDNVEGLIDLAHGTFHTGGYYYLHRKIPVYDYQRLKYMKNDYDPIGTEQLATHILTPDNWAADEVGENFELVDTGAGQSLWQVRPEARVPVRKFENYRFALSRWWLLFPWSARYIADPDKLIPKLVDQPE